MAMKSSVMTMNGRIVSETRNGVRHFHAHDQLGNTIALYDDSGTKTDSYTYWPYGEVRTRTGTTLNPFQFCGAWGYYRDSTGRTYVRVRTLRMDLARWCSPDKGWPEYPMYCYGLASPLMVTDPGAKPDIACDYSAINLPGSPQCGGIRVDWLIVCRGTNSLLYLKQRVRIKHDAIVDCSTGKVLHPPSSQTRLEIFPFQKMYDQAISDTWEMPYTAGPCTSGRINFHASYDIAPNLQFPPKGKNWKKLPPRGYHWTPYSGTWKGPLERSVDYTWNCCKSPEDYTIIARAARSVWIWLQIGIKKCCGKDA